MTYCSKNLCRPGHSPHESRNTFLFWLIFTYIWISNLKTFLSFLQCNFVSRSCGVVFYSFFLILFKSRAVKNESTTADSFNCRCHWSNHRCYKCSWYFYLSKSFGETARYEKVQCEGSSRWRWSTSHGITRRIRKIEVKILFFLKSAGYVYIILADRSYFESIWLYHRLQQNQQRRKKKHRRDNDSTYTATDNDTDVFSTAGTDIAEDEFFDCSDSENGMSDVENRSVYYIYTCIQFTQTLSDLMSQMFYLSSTSLSQQNSMLE